MTWRLTGFPLPGGFHGPAHEEAWGVFDTTGHTGAPGPGLVVRCAVRRCGRRRKACCAGRVVYYVDGSLEYLVVDDDGVLVPAPKDIQ